MMLFCLFTLCMTPDTTWHSDYESALRAAQAAHKDVVIHIRSDDRLDSVLEDAEVKAKLRDFVCLRVPASYELNGKRILEENAFKDMADRAGLMVVSMHDEKLPTFRKAISAHPLVASHYHWAPRSYGAEEVKTILDLPKDATLSQRSIIFALHMHPEKPASVLGNAHPAFLAHAERHSQVQARAQHQHHADLIGSMSRIGSEMGGYVSGGSEVVAESWGSVVGGETVLEAAYSCIDAWRHSSGHWGAVSSRHRYFGYDLARGANGTWYATGIFAD